MQRQEATGVRRSKNSLPVDRKASDWNSPRRLLLLEDNPPDADLIRRSVIQEWPAREVVQVSSHATFQNALEQGNFDLVLSDYLIPGFHGLAALAAARGQCPEAPFIFVSGAIND